MQKWLRISLLLCTFGFFRELRPSEPFVTEYLTGPWRNLTAEQVNKEVFPFGTYAILAQLAIVFLITDILRYKPIIILSACAGIILFGMLLWTKTIWELQIGQVFYGTFMASEVAYYTYIYAKVDRERYQIVTGHTRSAILCGKFLGGVLAQLFISTNAMDYKGLHYFSFGSQVISLCVALTLPTVRSSVYFHTDKDIKTSNVQLEEIGTTVAPATTSSDARFSCRTAYKLILQHTVNAYTNPTVVRWSIWWALATCGQVQIISYVQFLWKEIDPNHVSFYNGAVEATVTVLGAAGALIAGNMQSSRHKKWHMWILTICSLLMGAFTIISAVTHLVLVAYIMYILFGISYFFVITVASAIVAENLDDDSFGLIFGFNTLVALILQATLTLIVVTDSGFGLGPRAQYLVYGFYFIALAVLYCLAMFVRFLCKKTRASQTLQISS